MGQEIFQENKLRKKNDDQKVSDCKELTDLFYNTVHNVNAKDYTREQLNVWAPGQEDLEKRNESHPKHITVVEMDDEINQGILHKDKTRNLHR